VLGETNKEKSNELKYTYEKKPSKSVPRYQEIEHTEIVIGASRVNIREEATTKTDLPVSQTGILLENA